MFLLTFPTRVGEVLSALASPWLFVQHGNPSLRHGEDYISSLSRRTYNIVIVGRSSKSVIDSCACLAFTVLGEQLLGGPVHQVAVGQHAHPHSAVDEPGRFRGGARGPVRRRPGPVQRARL